MTSYITNVLTKDSNIDYLNNQIVDALRRKNIDILPQNKQKVIDLVYYMHNEWFNDPDSRNRTYQINEIIDLINKRVINYASRDIEINFYAAKRYQNSLNELPIPNDLPTSTTTTGIKLPENMHPN